MSIAQVMAMRSKDPSTQVAAVVVSQSNRMVGIGYNGFPSGCNSNALPWDKVGDPLNTKYLYVSHAEANALDKSIQDTNGCKLYTTLYPCNQCAIRIIQRGITEVIYLSDKYHDTDEAQAARKMFDLANIKTRKFEPKIDSFVINLKDPVRSG